MREGQKDDFPGGICGERRKEELRYMIGLLGNCEKKEHVVIVAVIPVSKYCTEMQKKKEVSTCYGEIEKPENCLIFV